MQLNIAVNRKGIQHPKRSFSATLTRSGVLNNREKAIRYTYFTRLNSLDFATVSVTPTSIYRHRPK